MEFIKGAVFATLSFEQEQLDRSTVKSYMKKHVDMQVGNLIGLGCITITCRRLRVLNLNGYFRVAH